MKKVLLLMAVAVIALGFQACSKEGGGDPDTQVRDDDMDGVVNNVDKCPNTPSGTEVSSDGCPFDPLSFGAITSVKHADCRATPLSLTWTGSKGGDGNYEYRVWIYDHETGNNAHLSNWQEDRSLTLNKNVLVSGTSYQVDIEVRDGRGKTGLYYGEGARIAFYVRIGEVSDVPYQPQWIFPTLDGQIVSEVQWSGDGHLYDVLLFTVGDDPFTDNPKYTIASVVDKKHSLSGLDAGTYDAYILSKFDNGNGAYSQKRVIILN